jgi:hypothetical protein
MTVFLGPQDRAFVHLGPVVEDEIGQELIGLHEISPKHRRYSEDLVGFVKASHALFAAYYNLANEDISIASSE